MYDLEVYILLQQVLERARSGNVLSSKLMQSVKKSTYTTDGPAGRRNLEEKKATEKKKKNKDERLETCTVIHWYRKASVGYCSGQKPSV